jgi:ubiquinone/menaquinone biosynthesis C-methylase UbiE
MATPLPLNFYDSVYSGNHYASYSDATSHFAFAELSAFIERFQLHDKRCLEVGSGRGYFQNLVKDYTGTDLSQVVAERYQKPFFTSSAEELPFENASFDAIWSITVLEHIPSPEKALSEMRRVLKPGGLIFLKPAWHCRPWACDGIPVRPFRDLNLHQKWIKLTLPLRESLIIRSMQTIPWRFALYLSYMVHRKPSSLHVKKLPANYERFWMADSDACSSIDLFAAFLWFISRGDHGLSPESMTRALIARAQPIIIRKNN